MENPGGHPASPPPSLSWDGARGLVSWLSGSGEHEAPGPDAATSQLPSLPGFIIKSHLGAGGSGTVLLGYRVGSDRPLAIKLFRSGLGAGDAGPRRAQRELELLMQLHLPVLPRVIDYGVAGGRFYIATEYIDGELLDRAAAALGAASDSDGSKSRSARRAGVELMARVADAVQTLHEHGVIHRDLKPGNIVIDRHGQPVLLDLGIAALLAPDAADTLTADGCPVGSPAFMAPEQARGERREISTRTDVYGLGATALYLLTGHGPYDSTGSIHDSLRNIASQPPRLARALDPSLPRALASVVDKAVAQRPRDRYGSAGEFAADLRRWLTGESVLAGTAGFTRMVSLWIRRHPLAATTAVSLVLAGFIVGSATFAVWWAGMRPSFVVTDTGPFHRWAEVRSYAGHILRRWDSDSGNVFARAVQRSGRDDSTLFLVATDGGRPSEPRQLRVYEPGNLSDPAWVTPNGPPGLNMPPLEGFTAPLRFMCSALYVEDVFPEVEGPEIIVLLRHERWAPCAIRIYDTHGRVLFETWHNGWIDGFAWLPGPRVLVLGGLNSEVTWKGRGVETDQATFPSVLMAIRPELGRMAGWISTPDFPADLRPLWYRCILPAETLGILEHDVNDRSGLELVARGSTLEVHLGEVQLNVDADGRECGPRHVEARYQRGSEKPDPRTFFGLAELPPIIRDRAEATRPANND
jgi:hypothetical protein